RPPGLAGRDAYFAPALWVVAPGSRLAMRKFPRSLPAGDDPVRFALEAAPKAEVRVVDPDGMPVAGAKVRVTQLQRGFTIVPDAVAEHTERTTDAQGVAD